MEWTGRAGREVRRRGAAAVQTLRWAWAGPGRERDLVVQAGKAALAAWVAWAVAGWWLAAPMAFVAPWVAVVLVESTVYRSFAHGLQQLGAIAVGTVVATGVALVLDTTMVTMALVLPTVLLLGQWQRLGSQGVYAATGALFVLTGGEVTVAASAARIAEAVFGAVVGVAVNALIRPPVYLRDTRAALRDAAREAEEILDSVADGLATGEWDGHRAGEWHERALRLGRLVDQARAAIGWSRESMRVNPRGRRRHAVAPPGEAYADALAVLDHVAVHTAGVTRTVWEAADGDGKAARPSAVIAQPYADFLRRTARAVQLYDRTRFAPSDHDDSAAEELREAVGELHRTLDEFRRRLPDAVADDPDALATYGTLLAQAHRLADQLVQD
ncbi:aromatic acid exporter family protein [Streptomyces europaeiscabiei]|uniref:aromatic acid exporter family protein n=1 Tax=Streptomyces europaeiscabiei TaxID=146819 RepID=UPI0029BF8EA4|nr:aromatic acid exporter family protein [Streptomyces europaeiscabiei]MDX3865890.1 aromatic acid exporter family protein [Streptomyces europaeiscabiei]MDX3875871.1 aromatic acid exporter family protein [Streptomyces europaeiscabiei]